MLFFDKSRKAVAFAFTNDENAEGGFHVDPLVFKDYNLHQMEEGVKLSDVASPADETHLSNQIQRLRNKIQQRAKLLAKASDRNIRNH